MDISDFARIPIHYNGKDERPIDAIAHAGMEAVAVGRRPTRLGMNPQALKDIKESVGAPRIQTLRDGTFNMWTAWQVVHVITSDSIRPDECQMYDDKGCLVADVKLGEAKDNTIQKHGNLE